MAIVEMSKMKLASITACKDDILNVLSKTGLIQLSEPQEIENTFCRTINAEKEEIDLLCQRAEKAVEFYSEQIKKSSKKPYFSDNCTKYLNNFFVLYDEFISIHKKEGTLKKYIDEAEKFEQKLAEIRSERIKLHNFKTQLLPYEKIDNSFMDFKDTKKTKVFFGTIKPESLSYVKNISKQFEYTDSQVLSVFTQAVVVVITINDNADDVFKSLSERGFNKCPLDFFMSAKEKISEIEKQLAKFDEEEDKIAQTISKNSDRLKSLKIYSDYCNFMQEKENDSEKFRQTSKTFVLEGFVPKEKIYEVENAIKSVTNAVFMEFSEPSKDDKIPTLTRNDALIKQAECITDMYSVPNYHEMDPNRVVFFFFMLFMGVIMADIGYGIVMIALGIILASKVKIDNGTKRLWNVIAIGGVFTILFGVLFNSFFGFPVLPFTILASPTPDLETGAINLETIMQLLLASLALGIIQIAVGYFCKAINSFKNNDIVGGLTEGLVWVLFFIGMVCALFNFLCDYLKVGLSDKLRAFFDKVSMPGLIIVIVSLIIAAIGAGRNEKGFGKFSKGFGTVYGLINIMSDILSYARLFGLMISGMIISQTFNYKLGMPFIENGGVGFIIGGIIIVIGHIFNLGMSVLGAYIHDCRLQYIEFFSKFYTGEGEKFTPLGSQTKYIYLTK